MQKIFPFLWFNGNAEEAVNFYLSVFEDSRVTQITHYPWHRNKSPGSPGAQ